MVTFINLRLKKLFYEIGNMLGLELRWIKAYFNFEWVKIAILCCSAFLVSLFLPEGMRIVFLFLFSLVLIISMLMNFYINNVYLFSDIYRFNASREGSESYRILEFLRFYGNRILTWLQVWLLVSLWPFLSWGFAG